MRESVEGVRNIRLRGYDHSASLLVNLWHDFQWGLRVARALPVADFVICNTVTLPAWLGRVRRSAGRLVAVLARMPKGHGRFYGHVELLLPLSTAVSDALLRENVRLADRMAPFPFPIDWSLHAEAGRRRHARSDVLTIGYIGRVHPEKGLSLLLRACRELLVRNDLLQWQLLVVGPVSVEHGGGGESYREELAREWGSQSVERLVFHPPEFDPAKLAALYAQIDVFCYPSVAEKGETFGVAIAEAMATRCAPVVSDLDCFRELVVAEKTGLTFDHRSTDAHRELATALLRLVRDPALRENLAQAAQAHVRQYDYPAIADLLLSHLDRLGPRPNEKRD